MNDTVDFACFGLDAQQKLSDDRYMVFFNQPRTPCNGVELLSPAGGNSGFLRCPDNLPACTDRPVFTAAIYDPGLMRQLQSGCPHFLPDVK